MEEHVEIRDARVSVYRSSRDVEPYIALRPPEGEFYIVAPLQMEISALKDFAMSREHTVAMMREEMKSRNRRRIASRCSYLTGDVVYFFGRPFMLRVSTLSPDDSAETVRTGPPMKTQVDSSVSLIHIYVADLGDYNQRRHAFLEWAYPLFKMSAGIIVEACQEDMGLEALYTVNGTPLGVDFKRRLIAMDHARYTVKFSAQMVAYPPDCVAYLFSEALLAHLFGRESPRERCVMRERACPTWRQAKMLLEDRQSPFSYQ